MPKFSTVHELSAGPKALLASAQIDAGDLRTSIVEIISGLRRVGEHSLLAKHLDEYFTAILGEADRTSFVAGYQSDLRRIALALSLINMGDL